MLSHYLQEGDIHLDELPELDQPEQSGSLEITNDSEPKPQQLPPTYTTNTQNEPS